MHTSSNQSGFTLIELLVVITIISIITSIALPQYQAYRQRGFDMRALSDLRMVAIAEEAYFSDWEKYKSCSNSNCNTLPGVKILSKGVTLSISSNGISFTGTASHPSGTGKVYRWESENGGLVN